VGVYVSIDAGASWGRLANNLPTVPVDDIQIHPRENDLVVGTHGRSIWILDDITPLEEMSAEVLASDARLFGARRGTMWSMGMDWPFQPARFVAANPVDGIALRYYLREAVASEAVTEEQDGDGVMIEELGSDGTRSPMGRRGRELRRDDDGGPVRIEILDGAGDVIRTLEAENEPGVRQVVWDFRGDPAFEMPGGGGGFGFGPGPAAAPRVLPGTYTARLTAGGVTQSVEFDVRHDPRRDAERADLVARGEALERAFALRKPLREANERLGAMENRLDEIKALVDEADLTDAQRGELEETGEEISAALEDLEEALDRANRLGGPTGSIGRWSGRPSADQLWAIETSLAEVPPVIERINAMLTERFPAFERRLVDLGVRPSLGDPIRVPNR
ncbi:MAG: hypothetical protein MJB57_18565, partial [Gemmatimonadetes bacterium]|nr:hypothetical protein [Gemmatimonadota bacterium]